MVKEKQVAAAAKAKLSQAIADDAQKDLNEALPALEAALASLKSLNKNDVVEVRALQRPPDGVRLVVEAVCIMKSVKPKKVPGEKVRDQHLVLALLLLYLLFSNIVVVVVIINILVSFVVIITTTRTHHE